MLSPIPALVRFWCENPCCAILQVLFTLWGRSVVKLARATELSLPLTSCVTTGTSVPQFPSAQKRVPTASNSALQLL